MKIIREILLLIVLTFILTSCNTTLPSLPSNPSSLTSVNQNEVLSPFTQFENLKRGEMGIDSEQVNNILQSYGIYDKVLAKVNKEVYNNPFCSDVRISCYSIGNKKIAVLLIDKGHLCVYVMFSNCNDKWIADGFAYQNKRKNPESEFRVEQSKNGTRYWLVVKHEVNHGTGVSIYDEIWYNPDGSVAAEYPIEGSALFFPQIVQPGASTYFSTSTNYDGDSKISLSYSIRFVYGYKDNFQDNGYYRFQSEYRPVLRDNWEYDLKTQQLKFISSSPALPESFSTMKHVVSDGYGILQGYIDFYSIRLGDNKITTSGDWEKFMGLK